MSYLKDMSIHERAPLARMYKWVLILIAIILSLSIYILYILLYLQSYVDYCVIFQVFWIFLV
jgi:hypothetical protein